MDELAEISNQIRNSRAELSHQRSNTIANTSDLGGHKRVAHSSQKTSSSGNAPITDVRTKRQSSNTIPAASASHLDDVADPGRQSAQLVPSLAPGTHKKKLAEKANIASHLNQQMLLQHVMQTSQP